MRFSATSRIFPHFDCDFHTLPVFAISPRRLLFNVARIKAVSSKKKRKKREREGGGRERNDEKNHMFSWNISDNIYKEFHARDNKYLHALAARIGASVYFQTRIA